MEQPEPVGVILHQRFASQDKTIVQMCYKHVCACLYRDGGNGWRPVDDEPPRDRWRRGGPEAGREYRDSPDLRRGDARGPPFSDEPGYEGRGFHPRGGRSPPRRHEGSRDRSESTFAAITCFMGWLGSRVVSVLDSGAEGPRFKSQS